MKKLKLKDIEKRIKLIDVDLDESKTDLSNIYVRMASSIAGIIAFLITFSVTGRYIFLILALVLLAHYIYEWILNSRRVKEIDELLDEKRELIKLEYK